MRDGGATARILETVRSTASRLPRVHRVVARPNVHRLASLARQRDGTVVLNLSRAVVEAGETAWRLLAPALEGERWARAELRKLASPHLGEARKARGKRRKPACQGTPTQQARLRTLVDEVRREALGREPEWEAFLPEAMELRISRRMTTTLGTCLVRGEVYRITLSERLFRPGREDILEETVRHELAHLADALTSSGGRMSHGRSWKQWALRLGARPERRCSREESLRLRERRSVGFLRRS